MGAKRHLLCAGCLLWLGAVVQAQDPNLIDVENLEQLNAIRYDLDGDGTADQATQATLYNAAFGTPSCPDGCRGYELTVDLDFERASSYASGTRNLDWIDPTNGGTAGTTGWAPIGTSVTDRFKTTFDGNKHTISNLYINRPTGKVGLFGFVSRATIRNLGIVDGNVIGSGYVGMLVAYASYAFSATACYATGNVTAVSNGHANAGGLIGETFHSASITSCYATANVSATSGDNYYAVNVGGLMGIAFSSSITACYATGNVTADGSVGVNAGGLVGMADYNWTTPPMPPSFL